MKKNKYLPFDDAKKFVHTLCLSNINEWELYSKSKSRPTNIPKSPRFVYSNEWKGVTDWLGTTKLPFQEARDFIHMLNFAKQLNFLNPISTSFLRFDMLA
jgi:hypothetical protein